MMVNTGKERFRETRAENTSDLAAAMRSSSPSGYAVTRIVVRHKFKGERDDEVRSEVRRNLRSSETRVLRTMRKQKTNV